jgi:hypothetical protein
MSNNYGKLIGKGLLLMALGILTNSFVRPAGGDSFRILLNGKMVMQHYVGHNKDVQELSLGAGKPADLLEVYYSHCGVQGKGRSISLRNGSNEVVKEWRFKDTEARTPMVFKAEEIRAIGKNGKAKGLKLYYSSQELPKGFLLANISLTREQTASLVKVGGF